MPAPIPAIPELDEATLAEFCRAHGIVEMSIFGSIARGEDTPDSDLDVLVTFAPEHRISSFGLMDVQEALAELVGRSVDLVERVVIETSSNPYRRESILGDARRIFPA